MKVLCGRESIPAHLLQPQYALRFSLSSIRVIKICRTDRFYSLLKVDKSIKRLVLTIFWCWDNLDWALMHLSLRIILHAERECDREDFHLWNMQKKSTTFLLEKMLNYPYNNLINNWISFDESKSIKFCLKKW